MVEQLEASGPPPYTEMFPYETALSHEDLVYPYDHSGNSEGAGQMSENLLVGEYTLIDQLHVLGAFMDTFAALYPQLQGIDFRETALSSRSRCSSSREPTRPTDERSRSQSGIR